MSLLIEIPSFQYWAQLVELNPLLRAYLVQLDDWLSQERPGIGRNEKVMVASYVAVLTHTPETGSTPHQAAMSALAHLEKQQELCSNPLESSPGPRWTPLLRNLLLLARRVQERNRQLSPNDWQEFARLGITSAMVHEVAFIAAQVMGLCRYLDSIGQQLPRDACFFSHLPQLLADPAIRA